MSAVIGAFIGFVFLLRWCDRNFERAWLLVCFIAVLWWLKP